MDFRFTEDQQDLIDAAKSVFDGENAVERMRAIAAGDDVADLWPQFAELGLLGIMAPESAGGLEQPLVVMAAIAEAAGYAGLPEPLVETAGIVIPEMIEATIDDPELSGVVSGGLRVSVQSLNRPFVHAANESDAFLFSDQWYPSGGFELKELKSIDPLRRIFKTDQNVVGGGKTNGATLTAAQLIGLSKRMLDLSVDYAKDRQQFGKPIGSFQAVKHQLANVHTQIEFTRPIIHLAALKGRAAVHNAKVAAIDTAMLAAETAIQVHGGMGYTYEVDLHLFMKRAWALCGEWGDRNYHMKKLEDLILDGDANLGPGETFNEEI